MKKLLLLLMLVGIGVVTPAGEARAQLAVLEVIKAGIKKVIKAVDLQVQRLQNKTIWLQNAQKVMENTMSKLKLNEITGWVEKQKVLYQDYFDELYRVKSLITYYHRIREITEKQVRLVEAYKRAWSLLKQDTHFSAEDLAYMQKVYTGILEVTIQNVDELTAVVTSFTVQMSDAKRMEMINTVADKVDENYNDLRQFNTQNARVSIAKAKDEQEVALLKALYGVE